MSKVNPNPTVTIKYSKFVKLEVGAVDNRLIGVLAPDTSGSGGKRTEVFAYDCDGYGGQANTTADLTYSISQVGGNPVLAMIGSNYRGGGGIAFSIITDLGSTPVSVDLPQFSSEMWSFQLVKQ